MINLEIQPELLFKDLDLALNIAKNAVSNFWSPHLKSQMVDFDIKIWENLYIIYFR